MPAMSRCMSACQRPVERRSDGRPSPHCWTITELFPGLIRPQRGDGRLTGVS